MNDRRSRLAPGWSTLILVLVVAMVLWLCYVLFNGSAPWVNYLPVTVTSDRSGLVMESNAKVKMNGVQVGRVVGIQGGDTRRAEPVSLRLEIYPDQVKHIPDNVQVQIRATTAFGAKYVDLVYPAQPNAGRLRAGQVLSSRNVTTEVNTVFQNLVGVIGKIDTAKLNATLSALAEGLRGQGQRIGEATTDLNQVLLAVNPRSDTIRANWQSLAGFADFYAAAAPDLLRTLDAAATTSQTITTEARQLDALLLATIGFSNAGINLLAPSEPDLIKSLNVFRPTADLLPKYNPEYTCLLVGAKWLLDNGGYASTGGNGKSFVRQARRRRTDRGSRRSSTALRTGRNRPRNVGHDVGRPTHRTVIRRRPLGPNPRHLPLLRHQAGQVHGRCEGGGGVGCQTGRRPAINAHRARGRDGSPIQDPAQGCPSTSGSQQRPRRQPRARRSGDQVQGAAQGRPGAHRGPTTGSARQAEVVRGVPKARPDRPDHTLDRHRPPPLRTAGAPVDRLRRRRRHDLRLRQSYPREGQRPCPGRRN
ncbi:MCE family protein [Mycobacteroides abscessus]|nr:MCE family protein [Mycobacteroides abscessus]